MVEPLTNKIAKTVLNGFYEIANESKRKSNKSWVDRSREFYNNLIQKSLVDNDILMYSTFNEGKLEAAETFIRFLEGKNY